MMTDDELSKLLACIKDSPLFGAEFCQYHPQFYAGFKGPIHKMDSSHHLSAVKDGERMRLGEFQHAEWAGYLQVCANAIPTLAAEVLALRAEVEARNREMLSMDELSLSRLSRAEAAEAELLALRAEVETLREKNRRTGALVDLMDNYRHEAIKRAEAAEAALSEARADWRANSTKTEDGYNG